MVAAKPSRSIFERVWRFLETISGGPEEEKVEEEIEAYDPPRRLAAAQKQVNTNVKPEDREEPEEDDVTLCAYCGMEKDTLVCGGCGAAKSVRL